MDNMGAYLDKLRALIPTRTFALYILGVGLVSGIADSAEAVAKDYGWMLMTFLAAVYVTVITMVWKPKPGFDA